METALETLIGQGVLGTFLVLVIVHFRKEVKDLKAEMKEKSLAHALQMKLKDEEIKDLNKEARDSAVETITSFNTFSS